MFKFSDMTDRIDETLRESNKPGETVILMGDFNFPREVVQWKTDDEEGFLYPVVGKNREGEDGEDLEPRLKDWLTLL